MIGGNNLSLSRECLYAEPDMDQFQFRPANQIDSDLQLVDGFNDKELASLEQALGSRNSNLRDAEKGVVTRSGNTLAVEGEEEDDDEKGSMSLLTATSNKSVGDLTVECGATNITGYGQ